MLVNVQEGGFEIVTSPKHLVSQRDGTNSEHHVGIGSPRNSKSVTLHRYWQTSIVSYDYSNNTEARYLAVSLEIVRHRVNGLQILLLLL